MTSSQTFISNQPAGVTSIGPHHGEQTDQGSMQMPSRDDSTSLTAREEASIPRSTLGDSDTVAGLEKELSNAKEELELMAKRKRKPDGTVCPAVHDGHARGRAAGAGC